MSQNPSPLPILECPEPSSPVTPHHPRSTLPKAESVRILSFAPGGHAQ